MRVAVLYGGRSAEHDVSVISGKSVASHLDRNLYETREIFVDKKGTWFINDKKVSVEKALEGIEVVFPVLHGTYGEDGKIQGLLEMLGLPYVGCGVAESVMGMDKEFSKLIWERYGLPVVKFVAVTKSVWGEEKSKIEKEIKGLNYPLFVKPANLGSSIGITKIKTESEILTAVEKAFSYGSKVVIEEAVSNPREIEVAVLGNDLIEVSVPGEIIPDREFYDYASKYDEKSTSQPEIPASLSPQLSEKIKLAAKEAYVELGLYGLARVDFLLDDQDNYYVNEVNTIPGFTQISMYPKLWEASLLNYQDLLTKLIKIAIEKFKEKQTYKLES